MNCDLLVVGGGIAGITATVEAAQVGKRVVLVEKEHYLGGHVMQMHCYFPKLCPPTCGLELNFRHMSKSEKITILTGSVPINVESRTEGMTVTVEISPRFVNDKCTMCGDCEKVCDLEVDDHFNLGLTKAKAIRLPQEMAFPQRYFVAEEAIGDPKMLKVVEACKVGAIDLDMKPETVEINAKSIIWATGWEPYDANNLKDLNYETLPNVVTNMMLERMAASNGTVNGGIVRPSDGAPLQKVAFVQCAGSRDEEHLPYCSTICCMASLKQSRYIREQYPDAEIHIFFIDARTPGRWEDFYQEVQDDKLTVIHRGKVGRIEEAENGMVTLTAENTPTGNLEQLEVDLAVLATGMQRVADESSPWLSSRLDEYGFIVNNAADRLIGAGVATGPKDVATSNQDAIGAVAKSLRHMTIE